MSDPQEQIDWNEDVATEPSPETPPPVRVCSAEATASTSSPIRTVPSRADRRQEEPVVAGGSRQYRDGPRCEDDASGCAASPVPSEDGTCDGTFDGAFDDDDDPPCSPSQDSDEPRYPTRTRPPFVRLKREDRAGGLIRCPRCGAGTRVSACGHNYIGHTYIGHNYIGHNFIGHSLQARASVSVAATK